MKKTITIIAFLSIMVGQKILIPMDITQTDHLKSYGVAFLILEKNINVEWLLNYRGGSFLVDNYPMIERECKLRDVKYETVNASQLGSIYGEIDQNNMDIVLLEKAPDIAVYSPPDLQPWDDAVTLALSYAEIEYDVVFDHEVLIGKLDDYDWLHLHHEDFTGQYGKFHRSYKNSAWYQKQKADFEMTAQQHGFASVPELKKAVALKIREYAVGGGFLFAMCSATDSFDISLASTNVDITASIYDGTPVDPGYQSKLDFNRSFAFENYQLYTDPMVYEYSTIDIPPSHKPVTHGAEADYFTLFEFSAKWDPVPTMLTQDHVGVINGFMGQTTAYNRQTLKKSVVIMAEVENTDIVKYVHGNVGKGTYTFLGGHDPEDYQHYVGDPPTDLSLHRNSPGYRLILNNVLFPAARKKERKT
ncbi:MAG: asparagine synthetase B [Candidatus Marinimicrobia bacterium]|nr:asparagine synthetase B [Candidatus Neomarinimicrobiota bacterium]MBL7022781.1 asparagine synthetase B [Candidatus Neomarinimicrobiota bacterium]MBL7109483.1 asparagine synthetase B [Candidatus Neomarinimicrobiota bacterium]